MALALPHRRSARAWASPGSRIPAGTASTAAAAARTSAPTPASPAISRTAVTPSTWWPRRRTCWPLPARYDDSHAAPLLCAGLIGYRAFALAGDARHLGIYGFGAAAHLIAQIALAQGRRVFAFTRPGDDTAQAFARELGVHWAGGSDQQAPAPLDAALIFAPVGALVPAALAATAKGGVVVCAGIHMSDIPAFPYRLLWGERSVRSVANLTRRDGAAFMALAERIPLTAHVEPFPLAEANTALGRLRSGALSGAAVLTTGG